MNWFTKGMIQPNSAVKYVETHQDAGCCEHVESDPSLARGWTAENDSFGCERTILCAACVVVQNEAEANEKVTCHDCHQTKLAKETHEYKWYGFYRPQGDEPLTICDVCAKGERHLARIANDKAELEHDRKDDYFEDDYQSGPEDFDDSGLEDYEDRLNM